jgi:hypothetical protein
MSPQLCAGTREERQTRGGPAGDGHHWDDDSVLVGASLNRAVVLHIHDAAAQRRASSSSTESWSETIDNPARTRGERGIGERRAGIVYPPAVLMSISIFSWNNSVIDQVSPSRAPPSLLTPPRFGSWCAIGERSSAACGDASGRSESRLFDRPETAE